MTALSVKRSIVRESIITVLFNNILHHIPEKYIEVKPNIQEVSTFGPVSPGKPCWPRRPREPYERSI